MRREYVEATTELKNVFLKEEERSFGGLGRNHGRKA